MKALDLKLLRDLRQVKGQAAAIMLVMACGIAAFIMSLCMLGSLTVSRDTYYRHQRFGDVFAHLERAPLRLVDRIREIPGVARVGPRLVTEVPVTLAALPEPAALRLVSVPEGDPAYLNSVHLRGGRMVAPDRVDEIVVSEPFAAAHGLRPGDRLNVIMNRRQRPLRIVGIGLSPEYIYQIRDGDIIPDDRRFGVAWMGQRAMAAHLGFQGSFNDLSLSLARGANERAVLRELDHLLSPYGGLGAYSRADQISNRFLSQEMAEMKGMGIVLPAIFLTVAIILLNAMITRLVAMQREQIATLKAFGYGNRAIGAHYLKFSLAIALGGVVLGIAAGVWSGSAMTAIYAKFFRFPAFAFLLDYRVVLAAFAVSVAAVVLGALRAVRRASSLAPALAMRPEPPMVYRRTVLEKLGLTSRFSLPARMVLRQIERQPGKALFSVMGIALAISLLVVGGYAEDAIEAGIDFQFSIAQRQDVTLGFARPVTGAVTHALARLTGVKHVETYRAVPVELTGTAVLPRRVAVLGIVPDTQLTPLVGTDWRRPVLHGDGVVLSAKLAELLAVRPGGDVSLETLTGERRRHQVRVTGTLADFAGLNAYMRLDALARLTGEGDAVNGAFLTVDRARLETLLSHLRRLPLVGGVSTTATMLDNFRATMAESILMIRLVELLFAAVIGAGVVYNNARISLSERGRDLATFRIIGFTTREISAIFLGELAVLVVAAVPAGLGLGYLFSVWVSSAVDTELFRIPLVIHPTTYLSAVAFILGVSVLTGLVVRRRFNRLDLIGVLKARE